MDTFFTILSIAGLAYVFLRLAFTVLPLQIKEARVVNGLAKLRRQLLISGASIMTISLVGLAILILSLIFPRNGLLMEFMVMVLVVALIVNAEAKHRIYHQQYTEDHKRLSRKIFAEEQAEEAEERAEEIRVSDAVKEEENRRHSGDISHES